MKKLFYCLLVLLFIFGFFNSCITKLPPKKTSKDSLLVIVVEQEIERGLRVGVDSYIELTVKNIEKPIKIRREKPFTIVSDLPRGIYETKEYRIVAKAAAGGNYVTDETRKKSWPFEVPFTLKPGHLYVFPIKFKFICMSKGGGAVYGWDASEITESEKKSILKELSTYDNFSLWDNDFDIH